MNYVWAHADIDFIVLCIRPMNLNSKIKKKGNSIIYIDPKNKKYCGDKVVLCDSFDFAYKFSNKDVIKLDVIP